MHPILVQGISTEHAQALRAGAPDANGQPALLERSRGPANPCRHCLGLIEEGDEKLVLAYRPFAGLQPYAELGPIFLHRAACRRYEATQFPAWFSYMDMALIRGYGRDHRILYETGQIVRGAELAPARLASSPSNILKTCMMRGRA